MVVMIGILAPRKDQDFYDEDDMRQIIYQYRSASAMQKSGIADC